MSAALGAPGGAPVAPPPGAPLATVCVFAKPPRAGSVKTRLQPAVGAVNAARLASAFLSDTWAMVTRLPWATPVLALTEPPTGPLPITADTIVYQGQGDLGQRLETVLRAALKAGRPVIAIGSDSPGLPSRHLEIALAALATNDAVIGPADDGGFYLLGLKTCPPGLLSDLPWSASDTCAATSARLRAHGCKVAEIPRWFDVDRPGDLNRVRTLLDQGRIHAPATAGLFDALAAEAAVAAASA